jgi:hypothetical protein
MALSGGPTDDHGFASKDGMTTIEAHQHSAQHCSRRHAPPKAEAGRAQ